MILVTIKTNEYNNVAVFTLAVKGTFLYFQFVSIKPVKEDHIPL